MPLARFASRVALREAPALKLCLFVAFACVVSWLIARESWFQVAGLLALLVLALNPMCVSLGLYVLLVPSENLTVLGATNGPSPDPTLLRYLGLLVMLLMLVTGWLSDRLIRPPKAAMFWSMFIGWSVISVLWAINPELAWQRIPTAIGLWLLYLALCSVRIGAREFTWITRLAVLGGVLASSYALYTYLQGGNAGRLSLNEGQSQSDPNFFAATLLLPLALATGEFLSGRGLVRKLWSSTALVLISFGIFATMSRGAVVALATIVIVFALRLKMNWRILVPILAVSAALMFLPHLFFERLQEVSTSRVSGRQDIWLVGLHSLMRYGAFGAGVDNFPNAYQAFASRAVFYAGNARASHNVYLCTAVELGAVGLVLFAAAIRSQLRELRRFTKHGLRSARAISLEAACWGVLVMATTIDLLWSKSFWLVWALSAMATRVAPD